MVNLSPFYDLTENKKETIKLSSIYRRICIVRCDTSVVTQNVSAGMLLFGNNDGLFRRHGRRFVPKCKTNFFPVNREKKKREWKSIAIRAKTFLAIQCRLLMI